ncbi:GIY-YIG nuclease family protein [Zongyangia hominis]|uniref:GIY-YIG nuclease family protein n=1 Tax=Zongyangia hominis TaxID=2763677 RepID=A0A926IC87_9FIRM|nr:GIY-YIG nuclease family protein [Zongyangia hominis]MBC8570855.1 GIY-YIG nuclease family protein [Zongyangia hominis]
MDVDKDKREKIRAYKERRLEGGVFAIRNKENGRLLLSWTTELKGSENRFQFAQMTGSCIDRKIAGDWKNMGREVFVFEVLDTLQQKEGQTPEEFKEDVEALYELWLEKTDSALLY